MPDIDGLTFSNATSPCHANRDQVQLEVGYILLLDICITRGFRWLNLTASVGPLQLPAGIAARDDLWNSQRESRVPSAYSGEHGCWRLWIVWRRRWKDYVDEKLGNGWSRKWARPPSQPSPEVINQPIIFDQDLQSHQHASDGSTFRCVAN